MSQGTFVRASVWLGAILFGACGGGGGGQGSDGAATGDGGTLPADGGAGRADALITANDGGVATDGGAVYAADEMAFLDHLAGIDPTSWSAAWDAAIAADVAAAGTGVRNKPTRWETPQIASASLFQEQSPGVYTLELDIPDALAGQVYDFEIIRGLQAPRWDSVELPDGLMAGLAQEDAPGGLRVYTDPPTPIPDGLKLRVKGAPGSQQLRINLTDASHATLGYTMASPGTVYIPMMVHMTQTLGTYRHFSVFSEVYGYVTVVDSSGAPAAGIDVTVSMNGTQKTVTTDASGHANYVFTINAYGTYTVNLIDVVASGIVYREDQNVAGTDHVTVEVTAAPGPALP